MDAARRLRQDGCGAVPDTVRECVVPLVVEIRAWQGQAFGIDPLMAWDEADPGSKGNPKPAGDHDWMIDRASGDV